LTPEEAAVAARQQEERQKSQMLYGGGAAALVGVASVVFWLLNSANKVSRTKAADLRRWSRLDDTFLPPPTE
jgi:hypothetical protein